MTLRNIQLAEISFDKGIDNLNPVTDVADGFIVAGENKQLVGSDLRDRPGQSILNASTAGTVVCTGIFDVPLEGAHYLISMYSDGKIYRETASTRTQIGTGFSTATTVRWSCAILQDAGGTGYAVFVNGVNEAQKWNPTQNSGNVSNLSASATRPTSPKHAIVFGDRVWLFQGLIGYWSDLLDCTTFTANNYHKYLGEGTDNIIGVFTLKGNLFVSTENAIHQTEYTGDAISPFSHIGEFLIRGHGYYHHSVAEISGAGLVYAFSSNRRIYAFDGVNEKVIDIRIKDYLDDLTVLSNYSWGVYSAASNEYLLSISMGSTSLDTVLVANAEYYSDFSPYNPRWNTKWTNMLANCFAVFTGGDTPILYYGCAAAIGSIFSISGSSDSGSAIGGWFTSKRHAWGSLYLEKEFLDIRLQAIYTTDIFSIDALVNGGNTYTINLESEGAYLGTDTPQSNDFWLGDDEDAGSYLSADGEPLDYNTPLYFERGQYFQVKLTSEGVGSTAKIRRVLIAWRPQAVQLGGIR